MKKSNANYQLNLNRDDTLKLETFPPKNFV